MLLMKATDFIETRFAAGSRPDPRTVRSAVLRGDLPGRMIMGKVYVDVQKFDQSTGSELADKVLSDTTDE